MKFNMKIILELTILLILHININSQEDLQVNILPSDKYKLSKRDLSSLKSDIERQVFYF
jgi:hypothetical protein